MSIVLQRETTEYVYLGIVGSVPSVGSEFAFLDAGVRPTDSDWSAATLVPNSSHPLWLDAKATGLAGDYYLARLVGSYGGNTVILAPGDYQMWLRQTDIVERPVRIAPISVEVL